MCTPNAYPAQQDHPEAFVYRIITLPARNTCYRRYTSCFSDRSSAGRYQPAAASRDDTLSPKHAVLRRADPASSNLVSGAVLPFRNAQKAHSSGLAPKRRRNLLSERRSDTNRLRHPLIFGKPKKGIRRGLAGTDAHRPQTPTRARPADAPS